jgi:hypothetical protein
MPDLSTPCRQPTLYTVLWPFQGWTTHRAGSLQPSSIHLDTPCSTPMRGTGATPITTSSKTQRRSKDEENDFLSAPTQGRMAWGIQGDDKTARGHLPYRRPPLTQL